MTARKAIGALALLLGAIALIACQPGTATTAPGQTTSAVATQATETDGGALPTFDLGSFAMPSFNADVELEEMLPDDIGGVPVNKISMTGETFLAGGAGDENLQAVLDQFDKAPGDLSMAIGSANDIGFFAYRLRGVEATTFFETFLALAQQDSGGASVTDATIMGKAVKKVVTVDETLYLYAKGDVLFGVGGDEITEAQLNEVFSKLP